MVNESNNRDLEELFQEKAKKRLELKDNLEKQFSEISLNDSKPLFKLTPKDKEGEKLTTYQRMLENNFQKPPMKMNKNMENLMSLKENTKPKRS